MIINYQGIKIKKPLYKKVVFTYLGYIYFSFFLTATSS